MGVKVPKEIQEIDLLTLRLRAEGSALVHHPRRRKNLFRNTVEPLYNRDVEVRLYRLTTLELPL